MRDIFTFSTRSAFRKTTTDSSCDERHDLQEMLRRNQLQNVGCRWIKATRFLNKNWTNKSAKNAENALPKDILFKVSNIWADKEERPVIHILGPGMLF